MKKCIVVNRIGEYWISGETYVCWECGFREIKT